MHPANPYYDNAPDFAQLAEQYPSFQPFISILSNNTSAIDFKDATALRELTRLLLLRDFDLSVSLPTTRLCPTLPNRLDYLLHLLALGPYLPGNIDGKTGKGLRVLDIGTGATAIYPILLCRLRVQARATATEIDEASLDHAKRTLEENDLIEVQAGQEGKIKLLRAEEGEILFPLRAADVASQPYTFTICNPPFYATEAEMTASTGLKALPAHAVSGHNIDLQTPYFKADARPIILSIQSPTASPNELLTPGGELAFISQMMTESAQVEMRNRSAWFTSLVGKAGSLGGLVARLEELKIDNYFVLSIRQAQTSRWIIGWSFSESRLPDSLTRHSSPSIAKHLPPPNHHVYHGRNSTTRELREAVLHALAEAGLPSTSVAARPSRTHDVTSAIPQGAPGFESRNLAAWKNEGIGTSTTREDSDSDRHHTWLLSPTANTWSRSARRQAQREAKEGAANEGAGVIFLCRLNIVSRRPRQPERSSSPKRQRNGSEDRPAAGDAVVTLDWLWGRDRAVVQAFWAFLIRKIADAPKSPTLKAKG